MQSVSSVQSVTPGSPVMKARVARNPFRPQESSVGKFNCCIEIAGQSLRDAHDGKRRS